MNLHKMTRREVLATSAAGLAAGARPASASERFTLEDTRGEKVTFLSGAGKALFEYRYSKGAPKPYVHPLCAPDGAAVTLDSPSDHIHHRGLMIGWGSVNGLDFWGEPKSTKGPHGFIVHQKFEKLRKGDGELVAINHWMGDGKIFLVERRRIRAVAADPSLTMLEWSTELRTAEAGDMVLTAAKAGYDGLGLRVVRSMDFGDALNSEGSQTIEKANGQGARWCSYYGGMQDGGKAGVAMFDHPSNPRYPTPYYVMKDKFGYMTAAPTFRDPMKVTAGTPLRLCYRVAAFRGEPDRAKLDAASAGWAKEKLR
jgi:hypothetical protein